MDACPLRSRAPAPLPVQTLCGHWPFVPPASMNAEELCLNRRQTRTFHLLGDHARLKEKHTTQLEPSGTSTGCGARRPGLRAAQREEEPGEEGVRAWGGVLGVSLLSALKSASWGQWGRL